ncbi:pyridoxamine 5'-phosphate oxidase family protein [Streptomyces sp. NPDC058385]|uniref:pyridoxamine 5'-phosphate oxidase family protein n=1 Tax=Streptomyces sp. NPDC058385 TaxID=3346473 RepID=UPI0036485C7A
MTASPAPRRLVEVCGAEALYLLEGSRTGRVVYTVEDVPMVRPASHVFEYGRLMVRTPVPEAALCGVVAITYHVDAIRTAIGTGWSVTATGPAEVIDDPGEMAHHRRALRGWTHGLHDTLLRIHPQSVSGFRLARTEEVQS